MEYKNEKIEALEKEVQGLKRNVRWVYLIFMAVLFINSLSSILNQNRDKKFYQEYYQNYYRIEYEIKARQLEFDYEYKDLKSQLKSQLTNFSR